MPWSDNPFRQSDPNAENVLPAINLLPIYQCWCQGRPLNVLMSRSRWAAYVQSVTWPCVVVRRSGNLRMTPGAAPLRRLPYFWLIVFAILIARRSLDDVPVTLPDCFTKYPWLLQHIAISHSRNTDSCLDCWGFNIYSSCCTYRPAYSELFLNTTFHIKHSLFMPTHVFDLLFHFISTTIWHWNVL